MSKTKTKWRLSALPTPQEVADLVKADILTKEEAREILISLETDEDRDKKSLQDEIKFLRELVTKLSNNSRTEIVKQIEYIEVPYKSKPWYLPYQQWMLTNESNNQVYLSATAGTGMTNAVYSYSTDPDFTHIKTF